MPHAAPLAGKVALVTGAARGIGLAIARVLAGDGASIVIADIQKTAGEQATATLHSSGARARYVEADVSREGQIKTLIETCVTEFGRLDIVVNNAARSGRERLPFIEQRLESWNADTELMLKGYMLVAQAASPHLKASGGGSIVNLSSALARSVAQEPCGYHVAKAGVEQLTRYLAYALGRDNIRVNAVAPGLVDRDTSPKLSDDPVNSAIIDAAVPLGRAATSADIARVVSFLCSPPAAYITGQVIAVDGGLSVSEPFGVGRRAYVVAQATQEKDK
jgi:glucose 1-dehydrogenase